MTNDHLNGRGAIPTITLNREELAEALKGFRLLKRKKGATKVPLTVKVEPGPHTVRLSALCLDHTLSYTMPAMGPHAAGPAFHLSAVHLDEAAKSADKKTGIWIDTGEKVIRYQTKGVEIEHPFHIVADEPLIETDLPNGQNIPLSEEVLAAVAEAVVCASTDESRVVLNGILLSPGGIAATNGRKLYVGRPPDLPLPEQGVILPLHPVLKLFTGGGAGMFRLGPEPKNAGLDRRFQLSVGPWTWGGFLVGGRYPNYRQVIPRDREERPRAVFSEEDARKLIEILPALPNGGDPDGPVRLDIHGGRVEVTAGHGGTENRLALESSRAIPEDARARVRFNRLFLLEALKLGFRELFLKDERNCVLMEDPGARRIFLWMPLRDAPAETPAETPAEKAGADETNRLAGAPAATPTAERNPAAMSRQDEDQNRRNGTGPDHHHGTNGTRAANGNSTRLPEDGEENRDPVETLLEDIQTVKEALRENLSRVNGLAPLVRQVARENKALEKEHNSLRRNIRGLKALDV